jgi:branched-subunit amino acid aminotransferase/4-amino-4-deoxychorismate lyase
MGESSRASVFVAADGSLRTAPVEGLLPGIGRRAIMQLAGVGVEEAADPATWHRADEIFVVSALGGVNAVTVIDGAPVGRGVVGPRTRDLAAQYRAMVDAVTASG